MNFLELVQEALDKTDNDYPATLASPTRGVTRMMRFVNDAYQWLWMALAPRNQDAESETTLTTVPSQNYVTCPFSSLTQVKTGANRILNLLPWHEFELNYRRNALQELQTGYPGAATVFQKRLYLYPLPDGAYPLYVRGILSWTKLSAATDSPIIREEFHPIIVARAQFLYLQYSGDTTAQQQDAIVKELVAMARAQANDQFGGARMLTEDEIVDPNWWLRGVYM